MRTIDADALLKKIEDDAEFYLVGDDENSKEVGGALLGVKEQIKTMPTIEPQRIRGKWIEREVTHIDELEAKDIITAWQSCKCSVCGRYDTRPYMYYFDEPKYCSWCGADMREKE